VGNQYPSSISKFSNLGAALSGSNGFTGGGLGGADGMAIDASGNLWVANFYVNSSFADVYGLVEFSSTGAPISGGISGYTGGGLDLPEGVAIDASGNVWIVNRGSGTLSEFNSSGTAISGGSGFFVTGDDLSDGIVIDASGNFWADNEFSTISEVTSPGVGLGETPYSCCDLYNPGGIAIDPSGNLWVVNWDYPGNTPAYDIVELSSSGSPISVNGGYTGGGIDYPAGIGSDGAGNIWVSNVQGPILSEFSPSGSAISPSTGYQTSQGYGNGLAIDGSGNIWLSSNINTDIVEFVGAATPVVTPVVANLMPPYGHQNVNVP
jgi:sugar lactone lactonase YvrE